MALVKWFDLEQELQALQQPNSDTASADRCLATLLLPCITPALLSQHQGKLSAFLLLCTTQLHEGTATFSKATVYFLQQLSSLLAAITVGALNTFQHVARQQLRPCVQVGSWHVHPFAQVLTCAAAV